MVLQESGKPHTEKRSHPSGPRPHAHLLEPAGGFRATDAPSLAGRSWEGYGRNSSSEAGLLPEQSLGARATVGALTQVRGLGALEELRALQGQAAW